MRIVDKACLARFRQPGPCEYCGRPCPEGRDPHHAFIKCGMGGGRRLDHPWNLASLCRGWYQGKWRSCHQDVEDGRIANADIQAIVARREGVLQHKIWQFLWRLLRLPKCEIVRTEEPEDAR